MIDFYSKPYYDFADLIKLVALLRSPEGCPWDSVQTHESIRRNFIEEVYEACEAIDQKDPNHLQEELGDVLLHVVFHAGIEQDAGNFSIDDVCDSVVKKQISRHPALFGGETGLSWDEIKRRERGQRTLAQEMDSVSRSLPALWRADKLLSKAQKASYPVEDPIAEMEQAINDLKTGEDKSEGLGRLLFSAVAAARVYGLDPEMVLTARCEDFLEEVRNCKDTKKYTPHEA